MTAQITQVITTIAGAPNIATQGDDEYQAQFEAWAIGIVGFSTQMETFRGQANALATEVNTNASTATTQAGTATTQAGIATTQAGIATTQATNAAASAAAATNAANVQGTSTSSVAIATALGQSKTYRYVEASRAIAVGMFVVAAVTASPGTNWQVLQVTAWDSGTKDITGTIVAYAGTGTFSGWTLSLSGPRGVAGGSALLTMPSLALSGTPTLVAANNGSMCDVAAGTPVTLDTLSVLGDGWSCVLNPASTTNAATLTADFGAGAETRVLVAPTLVSIKLVSGTYTVRWAPLGAPAPVFGALGTPVVINAGATSGVALAPLTATRSMGLYTSATGRPRACLVNSATGAVISTSGDLEAVATSGATFDVKRLTDTTAVATWAVVGAVKAVVLENSGETAAAGTVLTVEAKNSTAQALAVLTATKVLLAYSNTDDTQTSARTLTVSGTTLTANTKYTINSTTAVQLSAAALTSTQALITACNTGAGVYVQGLVVTEASNVLTFPAAWASLAVCGTANTTGYSACSNVSATRALVVAGNSAASTGRALAMVADITGTGTAAKIWPGRQTPITVPGGILSAHRLQRLSAASFLHLAAGEGIATSTITHLVIDGAGVRCAAAETLARNVTHQDIAWHSGAPRAAVVMYADADNSGYPMLLPINLGTVS